MSIGIIYGSSTGKTLGVADRIQECLQAGDVVAVNQVTLEQLAGWSVLLLGTSTWGSGQLQEDWRDHLGLLTADTLNGKTVALFGLGDQEAFGDTFVNGLGDLYHEVKAAGARVVGFWPRTGYEFTATTALENGQFVGLVLDEDNQPELTDERLEAWLTQIRPWLTPENP